MDVHARIRKTLDLEEPDRVPTFSQSIEQPFIERLDAQDGIPDELCDELFPGMTLDLVVAKALGFDSKWVHLGGTQAGPRDRPNVEVPEGCTVNSAGQLHERSSTGASWYKDGILKTPELLKEWISYVRDFTVAPPAYFKAFADTWQLGIDHHLLPIPTLGGPIYTTWSSIGIDRWTYMVRKHPSLVSGLINAWAGLTAEAHACLFEQGVDMVFVCDDFAQKDRLIMSPTDFDRFVKPAYEMLAANARRHDAKLLVHTDGNIEGAMSSIVDAGVHAVEPLEYEAGMRLKPLKERWGDRIALIGNVPASDALCVGSVEHTIAITKQCIFDAAPGGGFVLAPGANILGSSMVENVRAMIATAVKHGVYPIQA